MAFSASIPVAGRVEIVGDTTADTLAIDDRSGLLRHNRFAAGDPHFASEFDFDTSEPGEQTVDARQVNSLAITGNGIDSLVLGQTPTGSAGQLHLTAANSALQVTGLVSVTGHGSVLVAGRATFEADSVFLGANGNHVVLGSLSTRGRHVTALVDSDIVLGDVRVEFFHLQVASSGNITTAPGATIYVGRLPGPSVSYSPRG